MTAENGRRRYRRITVQEKVRMLDLYTNEGLSSVQIGKMLDRDPAIVRRVLHDQGTKTPKLKWPAQKAMNLLESGVPAREVSKIVGKDTKTIRQYAVRHGKRS